MRNYTSRLKMANIYILVINYELLTFVLLIFTQHLTIIIWLHFLHSDQVLISFPKSIWLIWLSSGAHTIGQTECRFFSYRLYNFTTSGSPDPTINVAFLAQLQALCPKNGDGLRRVALDKDSPAKFDVSFFKNVRDGNGVLESDQRLWEDSATQSVVQNYAGNVRGFLGLRFDFEFPKAMIKLSSVEVKIGTDGEIRKVCSKFNWCLYGWFGKTQEL